MTAWLLACTAMLGGATSVVLALTISALVRAERRIVILERKVWLLETDGQ